jgi:pyrimidine nucleoside transport protein
LTCIIVSTEFFFFKNRTEANALDAAAQGAANAVFLVANIIANLIAFLAFIAFLNGVISWYGNLLGAPYITFEVFMFINNATS